MPDLCRCPGAVHFCWALEAQVAADCAVTEAEAQEGLGNGKDSTRVLISLSSSACDDANAALGYEMFFWRTSDGVEVDFVLYGERGLHAFEVTRSSTFRERDLTGLRAFCTDYPSARGHLFYGGTKRYKFDAIEVVPLGSALQNLGSTLR